MKTKFGSKLLVLLTLIALLTSCSAPPAQPTIAPVPSDTPQADMPNPASVYCEQQGNRLEIRTAADGSQSGVCIFPDGSECDEWAYFRGECRPAQTATDTPGVPIQVKPASNGSVIQQSIPMPAGAIVDPRNGPLDFTQGLLFYKGDGLTLGELLAPRAREAHAAGPYQGTLGFPLVFQSFDPESQEQSINLNSGGTAANPGGQVSTLVGLEKIAMVAGLVGVPGEPVVFYIVFQPVDATIRSQFFLGTVDTISTISPILTLESNESQYWKPVAIQNKDDTPIGLWITGTPWGIGGGYFPHYEGLSLLDPSSGTITEVLPPQARFNSLSGDQTWGAYSMYGESGSKFYIQDLRGGDPLELPALPETDNGAGYGLFSPSNKYIAWLEMQGDPFSENYRQIIRIATLDGQSVGDFPDVPFYKTAELGGAGSGVKPVAWLDDENLLVQVTAVEKPHAGTVVKLNIATGQYSLFAQGVFAGLFYP